MATVGSAAPTPECESSDVMMASLANWPNRADVRCLIATSEAIVEQQQIQWQTALTMK